MKQTIRTQRLELVAETVEMAEAETAGRSSLEAALDAFVPEGWPPEGMDAADMFAAMLRRDPGQAGWLSWYWILPDPATGTRTLIGCGGFTSPPVRGAVAIGYSLLREFQGKGFAIEAVKALIEWAFAHPEVREIIAETTPDNERSRHLLKKAGFRQKGEASEPGHLRFALGRR